MKRTKIAYNLKWTKYNVYLKRIVCCVLRNMNGWVWVQWQQQQKISEHILNSFLPAKYTQNKYYECERIKLQYIIQQSMFNHKL